MRSSGVATIAFDKVRGGLKVSAGEVGSLHCAYVCHAEGGADLRPAVSGGAGFGDERGAARGHGVHALLKRGKRFEGVVGSHEKTVTKVAYGWQVCNNSYMSKHTSTKTITAGSRIILVSKGKTLGGGEVIAIEGRDVLIAQEIDYKVGADGAESTMVRTELAVDRYTVSRSVVAWAA